MQQLTMLMQPIKEEPQEEKNGNGENNLKLLIQASDQIKKQYIPRREESDEMDSFLNNIMGKS